MFRLAVITAIATFVLLLIGGLVHGTDSGLACPDWSFVPLCYGQLLPPMKGGVLYEHGHRLFASGVGLLTVFLAIGLWRERRRDRALAWLGLAAVLLVSLQGVLGGLTVLYQLPPAVSTGHLATSLLFLGLLIYIALRLRLGALGAPRVSRRTSRALFVALVTTYLQVILGALVRHLNAGLVCRDLPFCSGDPLPTENTAQLVHMLHRYGAIAATLFVFVALSRLMREETEGFGVELMALAGRSLVLLQVALGVMSVLSGLQLFVITAHLALGAGLLALLWFAWLWVRVPQDRPRLAKVSL